MFCVRSSIAKVSQADTDEIVRQLVQRAKAGEDKTIHAYARLLDQSFGRSGTEPVADPRPVVESIGSAAYSLLPPPPPGAAP